MFELFSHTQTKPTLASKPSRYAVAIQKLQKYTDVFQRPVLVYLHLSSFISVTISCISSKIVGFMLMARGRRTLLLYGDSHATDRRKDNVEYTQQFTQRRLRRGVRNIRQRYIITIKWRRGIIEISLITNAISSSRPYREFESQTVRGSDSYNNAKFYQ